ncbi:MAG: hypothetical protein V9E94_14465 [Microthrixaceae bacterium]
MARPRFRYSPWDGTQVGFELDALDVMEQLTDDLLYHGDLNAALRRMMQQGFEDRNGERMQGLREMLEQLKDRRRDLLDRFDLGGVYEDIANELNEVVAQERESLQQQVEQAQASGDQRRAELTEETAAGHNMELDMLPPDLAGKVRGLDEYDFTSTEAAERFEALKDRLREQLVQQAVDQMSGAMQNMTAQDMSRMKDMLAELNQMLEQRGRGEEPDFDGFMERHGDFFPENPAEPRRAARDHGGAHAGHAGADELDDARAAGPAPGAVGPAARGHGPALADGPARPEPARRVPRHGLGRQLPVPRRRPPRHGPGQLGAGRAGRPRPARADAARQLRPRRAARRRPRPGPPAPRRPGRGQPRADERDHQDAHRRRPGRNSARAAWSSRPRACAGSARTRSAELFRKLDRDMLGRHELERSGAGHERTYQTKPYEWGDPFNLHIEKTIRNAIVRGETAPVRLSPEDFEIEQTEHVVRSSTVLMLDLSLSMPMRDNFLPAKKVAMALHSLISMQYPRDYLGIVGFSEVARILTAEQLPEVSWDFVYGTNMQHGFQLARQLLARQSGTKQIIMITDGEPTAHINAYGEPEFHYPPIRETVDATLLEVARCTRERIRINTFMLDPDRSLQHFIAKLTEMNRGRAFYTTPENLGDYVLVDFIEQKRELLKARR